MKILINLVVRLHIRCKSALVNWLSGWKCILLVNKLITHPIYSKWFRSLFLYLSCLLCDFGLLHIGILAEKLSAKLFLAGNWWLYLEKKSLIWDCLQLFPINLRKTVNYYFDRSIRCHEMRVSEWVSEWVCMLWTWDTDDDIIMHVCAYARCCFFHSFCWAGWSSDKNVVVA